MKIIYNKSQSGQTLVETIIALFILTMALVSGLGLAIFAASNATRTRDQIIATNLAREGVEVVRMLRDSNWLAGALYTNGGGCTYPRPGASGVIRRPCYPQAFNFPHDLESGHVNNVNTTYVNDFRVFFDPSTGWSLDSRSGNETYLLCMQNGFYRHDQPGLSGGYICDLTNSHFARRVTITHDNRGVQNPYTGDTINGAAPNPTGSASAGFGRHSPEKTITSYVVWQGKRCTPFPTSITTFNPANFATPCKVIVTERISNWKDYQ